MLAKTIHVRRSKKAKEVTVYLKNNVYYFKVPKKLEARIGKKMLVVGDHGQEMYVKELLSSTEEEEAAYTDEIVRLIPHISFVEEKKKKNLKKKPTRIADKAVYKGIVLKLEDKKFEKTEQTLKFSSTHKVWKKVHLNDIVRLILTNKEGKEATCYVLVQEIFQNVPRKRRPPMHRRRVDYRYFYKKTPKGYKKTRYVPKEDGE